MAAPRRTAEGGCPYVSNYWILIAMAGTWKATL
jgi:hypothetical protein